MDSWAIIATYDENFDVFYLWTPEDDVCELIPDWKSDNREDNIWGFFVQENEDAGSCPFVYTQNWTYANYTYDEETMDPISVVGPWGYEWMFMSEEDFMYYYPSWYDDFIAILYGEGDDDMEECYDDDTYADSYGDGCDWYIDNPESCGEYDEDDSWTAFDSCCACGGGWYDSDIVWQGYLVDP
jgi:hypothetical protein